ncbi:MAG: cation-translocating P-type ATPase [Erysipelotrichaceae bacterium]|nr:cation-translocating P-type ATPase [Erysipelotrichaceae bacterium]
MYQKSIEEVTRLLNTDRRVGLTSQEAKKRLKEDGYNELMKPKKESLLMRFINQFKDLMIIILIIAAAVSVIVEPDDWIDSLIIVVVVLLNAILGVVMENQAEKSLESLEKLSAPQCKVVRDGQTLVIPSKELVKGDVILLEAGDMIPSDARIHHAHNLQVDESALTGESVPVDKTVEPIDGEVVIGDQTNMVFSSTVVTYGRGRAVVTATGMDNEVGKIAGMLMSEKKELTPLQVQLNEIGKVIGFICIFICAIVFVLEIITGISALNAFKTAVALAVAAVPEGLAATVTIVLALSVTRMVERHAIIRKLPAVETLGCTSIVCSDKTGTLTQNKMTVVKTYLYKQDVKDIDDADETTQEMLDLFTLCSDATNVDGQAVGDPTEVALVDASSKFGHLKADLMAARPRKGELAFDSDRKMMTVIVAEGDHFLSITKGGPDVILQRCHDVDEALAMKANDAMAEGALRVLAVATKRYETKPEVLESDSVENDMDFVGFVGMIDPARPEAKVAIQTAKGAGVRTIMITGDHKVTAAAIARELGILNEGQQVISGSELSQLSQEELEANIENYSVYARVAPEHKVQIVKAWQSKNKVVAMTGDGVNDAPALKAADIGCAMGITGTDVSKNAATMILTDDNFATIIAAIEQGRGIFDNIRKDVHYLLSSNVGEVLTIFVASIISVINPALGFGVPLMPVHLLWVNLITDTLPAFALGLEPVEKDVMTRQPRPKEASFFSGGLLTTIIWQGVMVGVLTLISYALGQRVNHLYGMTMAFITLSGCQLAHSFNVKSHYSVFNKQVFNNKYLWGSALIGIALQVLIITTPLSVIFKLQVLDPIHFAECILLALSVIPIVEVTKLFKKR